MKSVIAFLAFFPLFAFAQESNGFRNPGFNLGAVEGWFKNNRLNRTKNFRKTLMPRKTERGYKVWICAGAGCPVKLPFLFTEKHFEEARIARDKGLAENRCAEPTAFCERSVGLRFAVRQLEMIVWRELVFDASFTMVREHYSKENYTSNDSDLFNSPGYGQQRTMDCVDQATNGTTYLMILSEEGFLKNHTVLVPGMENLGFQPHFFSRIREKGTGKIFKFDLYDRSNQSRARRLPMLQLRQDDQVVILR